MKKGLMAAAAAAVLLAFAPLAYALPPGGPGGGGPGGGGSGGAPGGLKRILEPGPVIVPSMHRNYYPHHDSGNGWKSAAIGAGIGLLMGAIANSASSGSSTAVRQTQDALWNEAGNQQRNITQLISRQGVSGAMHTLTNYWQNAGDSAVYTPGNPISILQVSGFAQQPNVTIQYTVNQATNNITVTVSDPNTNQSAQSSGTYTLPAGYNPYAANWTQTAY